jgi:DNA-binding MarR family transcriptional regulator
MDVGHRQSTSQPLKTRPAELSEQAWRLYMILCWYYRLSVSRGKRFCWPSQNDLARKQGRSVASVRRYLVELEKATLIKRTRRMHGNRYYLLDSQDREVTAQNERYIPLKMSDHTAQNERYIPLKMSGALLISELSNKDSSSRPQEGAAADLFTSLEIQEAINALHALDFPRELGEEYARRDHRLCIIAAPYCVQRFQDKTRKSIRDRVGFIRKLLDCPAYYGFTREPGGDWVPPRGPKNQTPEEAEQRRVELARQRERQRQLDQEQREKAAEGERQDRQRWNALDEATRAALRENCYTQRPEYRQLPRDGSTMVRFCLAEHDRERSGSSP